jgi:hypothetical protein
MTETVPPKTRRGALPVGADEMLAKMRRKFAWLALGVFVLVVVSAGGVPLLFRSDASKTNRWVTGAVLGGIIGFCAGALPFAQWVQIGRVRRRLKAFAHGDCLAHWTYTPAEWRAAVPDWDETTPVGEAYVGTRCGYFNKQFFEWTVFGQTIVAMEVLAGPPAVLGLDVTASTPNGPIGQAVRIPVPLGKEPEARLVIQRLAEFRKEAKGTRFVTRAVPVGLFLLSVVVFVIGLLVTFAR